VRFGKARYGQLHSGGVRDGGEEAVVGVDDPALKAVNGLEEGGLEAFAEGGAGLMNRGIAAKVEPGVETRVALKDEVVGGVDTLDGRDDVKFEGWALFDTFGEGTRGWSPSGGKTSFRAPDDHLFFPHAVCFASAVSAFSSSPTEFFTSSSGDLFHFGLLELLDSFPMASVIFVLNSSSSSSSSISFSLVSSFPESPPPSNISLFSCRILLTRSDSSLLSIILPALPRSRTTLLRIEEKAILCS